jgi:hypothetical protein
MPVRLGRRARAPHCSWYSRCCVNPKFFDLFYDNFLASHPTIAPMFAKTDMANKNPF